MGGVKRCTKENRQPRAGGVFFFFFFFFFLFVPCGPEVSVGEPTGASALRLLANGVTESVVLRLEELLRELCGDFRIVVLARKYVQVYVRILRMAEVSRDEGCLDELCHRISRYPWILTEVHYDAFTETLHLDEVAKLNYELFNHILGPDGLRIASVEINPRM